MENIKIGIKYKNNITRQAMQPFDFRINEQTTYGDLIPDICAALQPLLCQDFRENRLYFQKNESIVPIVSSEKVRQSVVAGCLNIIYAEIVAPNCSGHIGRCRSHNNGDICFDIFPREHNHRFLPHVMASCGGETIRIIISEEPALLGKERYSGNNRKNEEKALSYVKTNWSFLMQKWVEIVESQFS